MIAIVAVDQNYAIGQAGDMLYHLPGDLAHFARQTKGKTLVMGRATLDSLPGGRPLPGRRNIVLSRQPGFAREGVEVVPSLLALSQLLGNRPGDEVFLIGGGQLYSLLIDCCSKALITKIRAQSQADTFFPNLDERPGWRSHICTLPREENGLRYQVCEYRNQQIKALDQIQE